MTYKVEKGNSVNNGHAGASSNEHIDLPAKNGKATLPLVGVIMGSDSDLPVMQKTLDFLGELGVAYEVQVVSAHRTPERMVKYAENAQERHLRVIIAGAGGAAHLPGMVASLTTLPVIGVPIWFENSLGRGVDALLSIIQMPEGVPVATVGVNRAKNAGILAARMLALSNPEIAERLQEYVRSLKTKVQEQNNALQKKQHAAATP